MMRFYYFLFLPLLVIGCQPVTTSSDPYKHIEDEKAKEVLHNAITAAGGLENWQALKGLYFEKYFALYEEFGNKGSEANQKHHYQFHPQERVEISWTANNSDHKIISAHGKVHKEIDGEEVVEADRQSLENTVLSATFVIGIPFKLLDEGVSLSYAGVETLDEGQEVHVIRAAYMPSQHDNHSTPDIWHHYYDVKDYKQLGYMVQHADHYSYVKNLNFIQADGFTFPHERKSYRVDKNRNLLYLRADYAYSEYAVVR